MTRKSRIEFLEQLLTSGKADSFAHYALALEYQKLDRPEQALATFERLRQRDPDYLPMYLMAGRLLSLQSEVARARSWLEAGVDLAKRQGDTKAYGELNELLRELSD